MVYILTPEECQRKVCPIFGEIILSFPYILISITSYYLFQLSIYLFKNVHLGQIVLKVYKNNLCVTYIILIT